MRAEARPDFSKDEQITESKPETVESTAAPRVVMLPRFFCAPVKVTDWRGLPCNVFFDTAANSFEQCRNIEKIIWRCNTDFIGKFGQISRKREFCFARESGKHHDPRSGEIQR